MEISLLVYTEDFGTQFKHNSEYYPVCIGDFLFTKWNENKFIYYTAYTETYIYSNT